MKTTTFVVVYSIVLLALFGVFCYLMSTVNPKPLRVSQEKDPDSRRLNNEDDLDLPDGLIIKDSELSYGLEKVKTVPTTEPPSLPTVPYYDQLSRYGLLANTSLIKQIVSMLEPRHRGPKVLSAHSGNDTIETNNITEKESLIKRSVRDFETDHTVKDSFRSEVIIKLIDNWSLPKTKKRSYSGEKSRLLSPGKATNPGIDYIEEERNDNNQEKDTVIKIMPNNTLIFDDVDNSIFSIEVIKEDGSKFSIKNSSIINNKGSAVLLISRKQNLASTTNEVGNMKGIDDLKTTTHGIDEVASLKVVNNKTTPFQQFGNPTNESSEKGSHESLNTKINIQ